MKISIVGYGVMGKLIEGCALDKNIEVLSTIDPYAPDATHKEFNEDSMKGVDACICFSHPDAALQNIEDVCRWKKHAVIGTTAWADQMPYVKGLVEKSGIGMVYSSNFSIGVNIFFKLIEEASKIMNKFDIYDVLAYEAHHNRKVDSPSGTAVTLAQIIIDNLERKKEICVDKLDRKIKPEELHFSSMRGGNIPGTHSIMFDSDFDTIELKHTARSRTGFAMGSVLAAEWICGKKGMFTESDMMNQLI